MYEVEFQKPSLKDICTLLHVHNNQFLYLPALGTTCIDTICYHTTGGINEVFYRLF
jgi:hypothetical protein